VIARLALALSALAAIACGDVDPGPWAPPPDEPYVLELPEGIPPPPEVEGEPLTRPRVELGRHLFYDVRLSLNETQSCASCHRQELAFTDGLPTSVGSTDEAHFRNAQGLVNVAYVPTLTWANPVLRSLAIQALTPLTGEHPVELGIGGHEDEVLARLREDERYQALFPLAFPEEDEPFSLHAVVVSLSAFQRSIVSFRSRYDRFLYGGERDALTQEERDGMNLFLSERFECFHCHGGFNFSDSVTHQGLLFDELPFHNTGLYNIDGEGAYPADDPGVFELTFDPRDMGRFRAPSLRNVAVTAPYFHDGSAETLDEVLDHYVRGGRLIEEGPHAGDGALSPLKSELVRAFPIIERERRALIAFLEALTDEPLLRDPRFENPWPAGHISGP
jgi:cytochrome c peroxidase